MGAEQSSFGSEATTSQKINFFINGVEHNVNAETTSHLGPETLLVDYIRDEALLKGTKFSCREGGCGVCVVSVKSRDAGTGTEVIRPVNSCLTPLFSCDGWDITTIEGLGNKNIGYHEIQKRLVTFHGTQCGFCSPGMVMNMHCLMNSRSGAKMKDIEDSFDGNICRCTGYRPILDAFKSLGSDATEQLRRKCAEVEDIAGSPCPLQKICGETKKSYCLEADDESEAFDTVEKPDPIHLILRSGEQWVKPTRIDHLFTAIQQFMSAGMSYRLVAGNTATGVFKQDGPYQGFIDITAVPELKTVSLDTRGVSLGGGITLSIAIEQLLKASAIDGFEYAEDISKHMGRIANVPVRSNGTLAGNLMIKHDHPEFPSDIFMLLETVGASLSIASAANLQRMYPVLDFLKLDMAGKVILSINFPSLPKSRGYVLRTFKITRRYQNAHAYVNAGFLFRIDPRRNFSVREKPSIVFGGIHPDFVHANATEIYFLGKFLGDAKTVAGALDALDLEVVPDHHPPDATPEYRKNLTQSLLYKVILGIVGNTAQARNRSGASDIEHGVTYGKQSYDTDKREWPINQPISKLEATVQCSGEAEYVNDISKIPGELSAAFVITNVANARLKNVDPSEALRMPGVISFLQAKDIPGTNNYYLYAPFPEEIFVTNQVRFAGAAVGLVVAETRDIAMKAAQKVKVTYDNIKRPILTIAEALKKAEVDGKMDEVYLKDKVIEAPSSGSGDSKHTIKGEMEILGQYHFQMETHASLCIPKEDGMDVFATTQWIDMTQATIASMLQIPNNSINIQVRRLGGGYGSKISRSTHVITACALAAYTTNKPVRMVMDLESNMKMMGKRLPYYGKYEVGFDDNGKIDRLDAQLFCDAGNLSNEITVSFALICLQSCYEAIGWKVVPGAVNTNKVSNTYCRAPGSTQGFAIIETIMEHIAFTLGKDSLDVKLANLIKPGDAIYSVPGIKFEGPNYVPQMVDEMKKSADYEERKKFIDTFNTANRWKKRGMAVMPMRYPVHYFSIAFPAFVNIYHIDGTVAVAHGGIEMGQGINTKVAQGAAYELKIPLEKIIVKPSNNFTCANAMITGGAITSEVVTHATVQACKVLNERLQPIREKMKDAKWENIIAAAHAEGVNLAAHHMPNASDNLQVYDVWGLNVTEVEMDMLTGEYRIVRTDLIEDCGISLSPEIDVGQVEGSAIMGLGLWTTEKLQYDETTGELITMNTWDYKPPMPKDIPEDFRVTFLKNAPNPYGVLRSKATGEPPLCMAVNVVFAMRNAINSARKDAGLNDFYQMDGPVTPEDILRLAGTNKSQFTF